MRSQRKDPPITVLAHIVRGGGYNYALLLKPAEAERNMSRLELLNYDVCLMTLILRNTDGR
jgi:hypothetical protein